MDDRDESNEPPYNAVMTDSTSSARRPGGRAVHALRPLRLQTGALKFAEGSVLIELGETRVLVAASIDNRVPPFMKDSGRGWLTAEYSMLPRATHARSPRAAFDLTAFPDRTLTLDCDVLQADGGTRTAAVTGAWVAANLASAQLLLQGDITVWPVRDQI